MTTDAFTALIEQKLQALFPEPADVLRPDQAPPILMESMRYSMLSGGKRLRPRMLLSAVEMLKGDIEQALIPACALEMIHTFSLIHDDLPGMDNDTIRRGRPTNHVVFGVGQAILAGDGLLNHAFELMLENAMKYPKHLAEHVAAMYEIAHGAGIGGMQGGQAVDLLSEGGRARHDEETLTFIQMGKTACMFIGAMRAAGRLCGATQSEMEALSEYAQAFGLMFQAADDLLDVEGDAQVLGKSIGKDEAEGKLTSVSVYGIEGTRLRIDTLCTRGLDVISVFGDRASFFRELIVDMVGRKA